VKRIGIMQPDIEISSLRETRFIIDSKPFGRSIEKTQVNVPQNGLKEVAKNRLTHSYETANSSLMIAASLAKRVNLSLYDIDYQRSLYNVSLSHDLGLGPFGHDGSHYIDQLFKSKGLMEGFDDNNNNLVVIKTNNIKLRPYVLASIIKYPDKLYPSQQEHLKILNESILQDTQHYAELGIDVSHSKRTIACQIMDEADRNSYTTADMSDFLCLAGTNVPADHEIIGIAENFSLSPIYECELLTRLLPVMNSHKKSVIKAYFSQLKEALNQNYVFCERGIEPADQDIINYREFINKLTKVFYIQPIRKQSFHKDNMKKLELIASKMIDGTFVPSKYYRDRIYYSTNELERLRYIRDMLAEVTDWYIIKMYEELVLIPSIKSQLCQSTAD
jgi:dGTP triphosphohydrolase